MGGFLWHHQRPDRRRRQRRPRQRRELAQLSNPTVVDTDGDGLDDNQESSPWQQPAGPDTDGDGLSDSVEVNGSPATSPILADSDLDGFNDPQELAAGTDPNLITSVPNRYVQDFDAFADGTRALADGSTVEGHAIASVQGGDLRLLDAGTGSTAATLPDAPLAGSDKPGASPTTSSSGPTPPRRTASP